MAEITFICLTDIFRYCFHEAVKYAVAKENFVVYPNNSLDNPHYHRATGLKVAAS